MEGSRMRTLLGAGLVLIGSILLLRALAAPVRFVGPSLPIAYEVEQFQSEQQREQIELQRAALEARRELGRARVEVQRELNEAQANDSVEIPPLPPLPELPAVPPLPPLPSLPPMPDAPPAAPFFHIGAWLNPPLILVALLALLIWRRGRRDRAPQQV